MLSPLHALTLSADKRAQAQIPVIAMYYCFVYPLRDSDHGALADEATISPQALDLARYGGYAYFNDGHVTDMSVNAWEAKARTRAATDSWEEMLPQVIPVMEVDGWSGRKMQNAMSTAQQGGIELCGVNALRDAAHGEGGFFFSGPIRLGVHRAQVRRERSHTRPYTPYPPLYPFTPRAPLYTPYIIVHPLAGVARDPGALWSAARHLGRARPAQAHRGAAGLLAASQRGGDAARGRVGQRWLRLLLRRPQLRLCLQAEQGDTLGDTQRAEARLLGAPQLTALGWALSAPGCATLPGERPSHTGPASPLYEADVRPRGPAQLAHVASFTIQPR
eukprot:scaffold42103_cov61-Phaeocystis_antarctica.AAC.1